MSHLKNFVKEILNIVREFGTKLYF